MIKIQLDRDALLELFKTEEAQVELRNVVIQNFMKKHMKAICNDETYKKLISHVKDEADNYIKEELFTKYNASFGSQVAKAQIREKYKDILNGIIETEVTHYVDAKVKEALSKSVSDIDSKIEEKIDSYLESTIKHKLNNKVQQIIFGLSNGE